MPPPRNLRWLATAAALCVLGGMVWLLFWTADQAEQSRVARAAESSANVRADNAADLLALICSLPPPDRPLMCDTIDPEDYRGEPGEPGAAGRDGTNGADGSNGVNGTNGVDGKDGLDSTVPGPPGTNGTDGANGVDGTNGRDGSDGKDGAPGPICPSGYAVTTYTLWIDSIPREALACVVPLATDSPSGP